VRPPQTSRLLTRLRALLARDTGRLDDIVALVAGELVAEVCSAYAMRGGELLELRATHGLNPAAVGRTRLRVGEGIVGLAAATGQVLNLADAQNHPAFAYRPETAEEPYASMLAVPIRRGGRTLGVLAVQNRAARHYAEDEIEVLETVAMLLTESLAAAEGEAPEKGFSGTLPRQFDAVALSPGLVLGTVMHHRSGRAPKRLLADDPAAELARLEHALAAMRQDLDTLIDGHLPDGDAPREVLDATRRAACTRRSQPSPAAARRTGLSAEAAIHRVASDMRGRMRRIADPYLRERVADLEDLAERLLAALDGGSASRENVAGAILVARRLGPAQVLEWHRSGIAGLAIEEASGGGHAAILARALGLPALGSVRGLVDAATQGDHMVLDAENGTLILRPDPGVRAAFGQACGTRPRSRATARNSA
jgi:phosphotransferase system enzyme I (PtsP)